MEMTQGLIEFNWSSLMILCNVFILYIILRKFFWEKIKKFMDDRAAAVQDAIDAAEAVNKRADEKMANYSKRIANVEEEGREIIKASKQQADAQAQIIIEEARQQASDIIAKAERTIEQEKAQAMEEMRKEIASIAMLAAEQIVGREIDSVGQDAIIDQAIEDARSAKWQN
ncbi:MAG: F0F1 ATP synthase subunit B [Clostridiales bacterium]|jgi:F-type H+-transporting ATPase subunit b|nr:F0F1 ATP synthase subunit B [Clostridiales bacterium]